jgi:hypothetical protein
MRVGQRAWTTHPGAWNDHFAFSVDGAFPGQYACDTPFDEWRGSFMTVLPDGQVVMALTGFDERSEVVLLDWRTHKIATLARGRSPVAMLDDNRFGNNPPQGKK